MVQMVTDPRLYKSLEEKSDKRQIKLLTYNLFMMPPPKEDRWQLQRLEYFIK